VLTSEAGFEKLAEIPLFFLSTKTNTARAAEQGIHQKGASSGHRCSREVLVLYTGDGPCARRYRCCMRSSSSILGQQHRSRGRLTRQWAFFSLLFLEGNGLFSQAFPRSSFPAAVTAAAQAFFYCFPKKVCQSFPPPSLVPVKVKKKERENKRSGKF
jgi:hypothetical protein